LSLPPRLSAVALTALALAGCVPASAPPLPRPAPPPASAAPARAPAPVPAPAPAPPPGNWQDGPLSPGDWSHRSEGGRSSASFGVPGAAPSLTIHCTADFRVEIGLTGAPGAALVLRSSFGERRLGAVSIAAADPLLDQLAFSRGRILVQAESGAGVIAPSWPELARVVEDCRR
jgi:hypothetical protein